MFKKIRRSIFFFFEVRRHWSFVYVGVLFKPGHSTKNRMWRFNQNNLTYIWVWFFIPWLLSSHYLDVQGCKLGKTIILLLLVIIQLLMNISENDHNAKKIIWSKRFYFTSKVNEHIVTSKTLTPRPPEEGLGAWLGYVKSSQVRSCLVRLGFVKLGKKRFFKSLFTLNIF